MLDNNKVKLDHTFNRPKFGVIYARLCEFVTQVTIVIPDQTEVFGKYGIQRIDARIHVVGCDPFPGIDFLAFQDQLAIEYGSIDQASSTA